MRIAAKVFAIIGIVSDIVLFLYAFIFLIISGGGGGGLNLAFLTMAIVFGAFSIIGLIVGAKIISSINIHDKKVYLGILGLVFLSFIGGLFYLLWEPAPKRTYSSSLYGESNKQLDTLERAAKISIYEKQLRAGQITPDEYKRKLHQLDGNKYSTTTNGKPLPQKEDDQQSKKEVSENERIELIVKYKKLLDDGVITQEEFESKKKALLNSDSLIVEEKKDNPSQQEADSKETNEKDGFELVLPSDIIVDDSCIQVKNGKFALSSLSKLEIKENQLYLVVFGIKYKVLFEDEKEAETFYDNLKRLVP